MSRPLGRPAQFVAAVALDAAMETFWRRGYAGTSLSDLLAATGLSRSSLYQAFGNKQRLFERCLERYETQLEARMRAALDAAPRAWDFLHGVLEDVAREPSPARRSRGCLVLNTARELAALDGAAADIVRRSSARMAAVFAHAVQRAQREGDIPAAADPGALGLYFLTSISGLRNLVQARLPQRQALAVVSQVLAGLR